MPQGPFSLKRKLGRSVTLLSSWALLLVSSTLLVLEAWHYHTDVLPVRRYVLERDSFQLHPHRRVEEPQEKALALQYYSARYGISEELSRSIYNAAVAEGVDPDLGFRLVRVESVFHPRAVSRSGALGLTQLMPSTIRWLDPSITERSQMFDRTTNLRLGFRFLRMLLKQYDGDVELALAAYNQGPGYVDRTLMRGGNPFNGYEALVVGPPGSGHSRQKYRGTGVAELPSQ